MKIIVSLLFLMLLTFPPAMRPQTAESDNVKKANKMPVNVPVTVSDREGRYISGLKREDFSVFEGGVKQEITSFATYDEPISIALLLDTSGSTENVLSEIKVAAKDFINLLNRNDQCIIATFDSQVKILSQLTSNRQTLKNSVDKIRSAEIGGTLMYRAVEQITQTSFANVQGRKVIVLLTDGKDFGSPVTKDELLSRLEESDVSIYTVFYKTSAGFYQPTTKKEKRQSKKSRKIKNENPVLPTGPVYLPSEEEIKQSEKSEESEAIDALKKMSDTTAGRFYQSDTPKLSAAFEKVASELREQYQLGYYSKDAAKEEGAREIIVKVNRPDAVVLARAKIREK